jgi:hypothetical protein
MNLEKGMFGHEFAGIKTPFKIVCGQMRGGPGKITHNSGWYNLDGEKLGWGDLSDSDFKNIQAQLESDQKFVVLSEQDSYWNFVKMSGSVEAMTSTINPAEKHPGREYLIEHARFVITPSGMYWVDEYNSRQEEFTSFGKVRCKRLTREQVLEVLC